eukprot:6200061-Pleurochrysis_carterae.AAC.3
MGTDNKPGSASNDIESLVSPQVYSTRRFRMLCLLLFLVYMRFFQSDFVSSLLPPYPVQHPVVHSRPWAFQGTSECSSWTRADNDAHFCLDVKESDSPLSSFDPEGLAVSCGSRAEIHICRSQTSHVRTMIAGPFDSKPGAWVSIALDYSSLLVAGDRVVSATADASGASGEPVPFPPLHMHQIHVMRGTAWHWYETYGDFEMDAAEGYVRRLPDGFCDTTAAIDDESRQLTAMIHDVRTDADAKPGADTLEWYLRLSFRVQPEGTPCRAVEKLIIWHPLTRFSVHDRHRRYAVFRPDSLMWWTVKVPHAGTLMSPYLHSSRARDGGFLLVKGKESPMTLAGVDGPFCESYRIKTKGRVNPLCSNRTVLRAKLIEAAGSRLVCADDAAAPSFVRRGGADASDAQHYERAGRLSCAENAALKPREDLT